MVFRFLILVGVVLPLQVTSQETKQMIKDYYRLIQEEQYAEAMNFNYLAQGSEEDKEFIISLMSGDDDSPGYGAMIQDVEVVKIGKVIENKDRSFASAKVILSISMPLGHLESIKDRKEEVEIMQWSYPDAFYNESTESCVYKEHLNIICILENGRWMLTDEKSYRFGLLEGVVDEEVWSKL